MGRRPWRFGAFAAGFLGLAAALLLLLFGGPILNRYGKGKVERAFAKAYPGSILRIGELRYALGSGRLVAQTVTVRGSAATFTGDRLALTGIGWWRLFRGRPAQEVLAKARFEATNLDLRFAQAGYGLRCARLRASVPDSELTAAGTVLESLIPDEVRFAARFRTTRFRVGVPECAIQGLAMGDCLQGLGYRAREVRLARPTFDALVNRDKPVEPARMPPAMVNEALAALEPPVWVGKLAITEGHIKYAERLQVGAAPGVLTFAAVGLSAEDIGNRGAAKAIRVAAQGRLMDAGVLKVRLTLPLTPSAFSLHYAGSLSAMDLTRLDGFLDRAEHTRLKSGRAEKVTFQVAVNAGQAQGEVHASYRDLKLAILDAKTGTEKGLDNRLASFLANRFKIRPDNPLGSEKVGRVAYRRGPNDTFIQVLWFSLRSGVLDVIYR